MSGQSGPEYPGSRDGLVFSVDPKNPRMCSCDWWK